MADVQDDEAELHKISAFASKWSAYFAKHGTGYYEHMEKDMEFRNGIIDLITAHDQALLDKVLERTKDYFSGFRQAPEKAVPVEHIEKAFGQAGKDKS